MKPDNQSAPVTVPPMSEDEMYGSPSILAEENAALRERIGLLEGALSLLLETHCCDTGEADYKPEWVNDHTTVCSVCRAGRAALESKNVG